MKTDSIVPTLLVLFFLLICQVSYTQETSDYYRTTDSLDAFYKSHPNLMTEPEGGYLQYIRWKEFWRNRVYGKDSIRKGSIGLWLDAVEKYQTKREKFQQTPIGSFWYQLGPEFNQAQMSGLVSSVYVDTIKDKTLNTIYIGTNASGVWKTTNGGQNWVNVTDNMGYPNLGITHITGDPNTVDVIYASTGGNSLDRQDILSGYGIGILKTTDGGNSWSKLLDINPVLCSNVFKIMADPTNSLRMYALRDSCVYRTVDGGNNWKIIFDLLDKYNNNDDNKWLRDIEMHPSNPDVIYIASDDFNGWHNTAVAEVWKTNNATADNPNWIRLDTLLLKKPAVTIHQTTERYEIEVCPKDPNAVWIICQDYYDSLKRKKIWKSYDSANTWAIKFNDGMDGGIGYHRLGMKISPVDTGKIYCFGLGATRLNNWVIDTFTETGHIDVRSSLIINRSAYSPIDTIFVGNDGGISSTTNSGNSWTNLNGNNLVMTQFWGIGGSRKNPFDIFGGTMDNNFFAFKNGLWSNIDYGDFGNVVVAPDSTNYLFTNKWNSGNLGYKVLRSSDGGISFDIERNPTGAEKTLYNRPLVINPQNPKSLITGGHNLHKSSNRGLTYDTIWVPSDIKPSETIGSICISPNDSNIIYIAFTGPHWGIDSTTHKLLKSTDHGINWTNLADSIPVIARLGVSGIEISPNSPDSVWVTLGGFSIWYPADSMLNKVYFTHNGGINWKDISKGLPDFPVNCIKYRPRSNGGLFVGTDVGVFYRDNAHPVWEPFNTNLPKCIITDLEINDSIGFIRAATFGRGIYESDISCPFLSTPLLISQNTTWNKDTVMDRSIVVDSLVTFTIKCKVSFPYQAKIYVKQGGKLIVDGGHLTNACFNNWQGIEVWGNANLSPYPPTNQGYVWLKNGAILEHARIGIATCRSDSTGKILWNTTGGIIVSDQAIFRNNFKAVALLSYSQNQVSNFNRTVFQTTDDIIDGYDSNPSDFVSLFEVKGVRFFGCSFQNISDSVNGLPNTIPNLNKGQGIYSINSQYYLDSYCQSNVQPCPPDSLIHSSFRGLHYGIKQLNYRPIDCLRLNQAKFFNNYRGVYLSAADFADITSNEFNIPAFGGLSSMDLDTCYGLYLGNCTGYHVENNKFYVRNNTLLSSGQQMRIREIGIIVDSSGGAPNEIYRNRFDSLDLAINAQRCNRDDNKMTGLVLKCNTYFNNSYDEMVTRENVNGVEGIARNQGNPTPANAQDLAGNTFSPYHESVQLPETDIMNEGELIYYFHHIPQSFPGPRLKPELCDTMVVKARPKPFDFDTTGGCCPSKLESQGSSEDLKELIGSEQQSIDSLNTLYLTLVDGGNTSDLSAEILFSIPPDAISLQQELLSESPYLSDTVMQTAISKEDVLPNAMIRNILVANPQSAKSNNVLSSLDNRFTPMPEPMMAEILEGQSVLSAKEELQSKISAHESARKRHFNDLLRLYQSDTLNVAAQDSLIMLLQNEDNPEAKYLLAFEYLETDDTIQADQILDSIPVNFQLLAIQAQLHEQYLIYFGLLKQLNAQNKSILEINQNQIATIENLAFSAQEPVNSYARNILIANGLFGYSEPILLPDLTKSKLNSKKYATGTIQPEIYFKLFPNPANHYAIIEYNLKNENIGLSGLSFLIYNSVGKQVDQIIVNKPQDQFILLTKTYSSGAYICSLINNGKAIQSITFMVAN